MPISSQRRAPYDLVQEKAGTLADGTVQHEQAKNAD
jgi:hypothetical protein